MILAACRQVPTLVHHGQRRYYLAVGRSGSYAETKSFIVALLALACMLSFSSCEAPGESVAIIDPIFAYLAPSAVEFIESTVKNLVVLPEIETSSSLYGLLDSPSGNSILLSPLLGSEIEAILSRNDSTFIGYFGENKPKDHPRLFSTIFSSVDAARLAGAQAAIESLRQATGTEVRVAAVFAQIIPSTQGDSIQPREASEAFLTSYRQSGGVGEPYIEVSQQSFSQPAAERLAKLDIQVGYVSASPRETERWILQSFDEQTFMIVEYALPEAVPVFPVSALIEWDMEATLRLLHSNVSQRLSGSSPGPWKYVVFDKRFGKP